MSVIEWVDACMDTSAGDKPCSRVYRMKSESLHSHRTLGKMHGSYPFCYSPLFTKQAGAWWKMPRMFLLCSACLTWLCSSHSGIRMSSTSKMLLESSGDNLQIGILLPSDNITLYNRLLWHTFRDVVIAVFASYPTRVGLTVQWTRAIYFLLSPELRSNTQFLSLKDVSGEWTHECTGTLK